MRDDDLSPEGRRHFLNELNQRGLTEFRPPSSRWLPGRIEDTQRLIELCDQDTAEARAKAAWSRHLAPEMAEGREQTPEQRTAFVRRLEDDAAWLRCVEAGDRARALLSQQLAELDGWTTDPGRYEGCT